MSKQLEKKHTLATRWMHWLNFPLLGMMIWSGLLIYWANAVYSLRLFGYELFHFFPPWFYDALGSLTASRMECSCTSFSCGCSPGMGSFMCCTHLFPGEWRGLLPVPSSFRRAPLVALHDAHLVKELPPQGKYNDAQRIAYTLIILMGAGSVITGLAIYKPTQLAWLTTLLGGYEWRHVGSIWLMIAYVLFFVVHIIQVVMAGWRNFGSMITGYDMVEASDAEPPT